MITAAKRLPNKSFLYNEHKPILGLSNHALNYKIMQVTVINVEVSHMR